METISLVKLKMKKIYKTSLTFIGILLLIVLIVGFLYLFYDKVIDPSSDIEVNGALSINYVNGKSFNITDNTKIKFSISNSSDTVKYYNIGFLKVRGEGTYRILYNDSLVTEGTLSTVDEVTTDYISIDALETKLYTLELDCKENLKGAINIRVQNDKMETFADTIIKNNSINESSLTKVGSEAGLEDEGLIKSIDDIGVSYYFRGNTPNNYFSLNDMLWRIVRINGDGTVRIVLNDLASGNSSYYKVNELVTDFENTVVNTFLDAWYEEHLRGFTNYIANTRYCNDTTHNDNYEYLAYTRIITNKIPTFNCLSNLETRKIGLLTIDEVVLAGASPDVANKNYYLYNPSINDSWYTMTGAKGNEESLNLFMIDPNGKLKTDIVGSSYHGVRPVINLIKNLEVSGTGTINDPYKIKKE